jgi:hypothetical protein
MDSTDLGCLKHEIKEEVMDNVTELGVNDYNSDGDVQPQSTLRPLSASLFTITKSKDHLLTASDIYQDTDLR